MNLPENTLNNPAQEPVNSQLTCPHCGNLILPESYFCPSCGQKLKDKPPSTTIAKQIVIYLTSFFLPPLGLWPAFKYIKQKDSKSKTIGFVALFLTIVSLIVSIWITTNFINSIKKQVNNQQNLYNEIGL